MKKSFTKVLQGYLSFREKYALGDTSVMQVLSHHGQQPQIMVVACCDSRVDPAVILQCDPGDLFVVRNVANIIPPFERDSNHHGTSAALEFGIRVLKIKNLILLGHSQCGGIQALLNNNNDFSSDFISNWVSLVKNENASSENCDDYAKIALNQSYENCLSFPWIQDELTQDNLTIHRWFFDIKMGQIYTYGVSENTYQPLESSNLIELHNK